MRITGQRWWLYQSLLRSDFSQLSLLRFLMAVCSGKRMPRVRVPSDFRQRLQGTGFAILAEVPVRSLSSVSHDDSGVPMEGAPSTSLWVILLGLVAPVTPR